MAASAIRLHDTLWTPSGDPVSVTKVDSNAGTVSVNNDFSEIQKNVKFGVKNGLDEASRQTFSQTMAQVDNSDKQKAVNDLFEKIKKLKTDRADPRLLRYLNNELQYTITKERVLPVGYSMDAKNFEV